VITYESPLNERIRTLLRLEDLFDKAGHFLRGEGAHEHHVVLVTLFEILDVASRADLKFDLVQELERQRQVLLGYRNNPGISENALSGALYEIEQSSASLLAMAGKIGHYLRENEWLMSIKSRVGIPGGANEFDLPSYHYWLNRDSASRHENLVSWITPMLPIRDGLAIVLRLLRSSSRAENHIAVRGSFSQMIAGRPAQLVRLRLKKSEPFIPEISANKYALNIRFTSPDGDLRPRQSEADVAFELAFCSL
jgi:cell division protein ZapD